MLINEKSKEIYLVDTSAFVVFEELFPFDQWQPIWQFLSDQVDAGKIFTTSDVIDELKKSFYDKKITDWVSKRSHKIKIENKEEHFNYLQDQVLPNCDGLMNPDIVGTLYADPMIIAIAGHEGCIVITDEGKVDMRPNTNPKNLKIPNHCAKIGIPCIYGRYAWTEYLKKAGLVVNGFKIVPTVS